MVLVGAMVALVGAMTMGAVVSSVDSTIGLMALAGWTIGLATISALMLNIEFRFDVESRFSTEGVGSVRSVENVATGLRFDLIAGLRLCAFNTVCCLCLMRSSLFLGRSPDLLVNALGFPPSLPGQN